MVSNKSPVADTVVSQEQHNSTLRQ